MRFDLQAATVMGAATLSSLAVAWWLTHQEPRVASAMAATPEQAPATSVAGAPAQIVRAADGHYWADAVIDGRAVRVLVDTGASVVALTRADAHRLGLTLQPSDFDRDVETASGPVKAAAVRLAQVAVAGVRVDDVEALVIEDGLPHSLLGMSYLGRLSAFEARPTGLTLRP